MSDVDETSGGPEVALVTLPQAPQRLHPLSPVVRMGRSLAGLVIVAISVNGQHGAHNFIFDYVALGVAVLLGLISWLVTTWSIDGDALQVHSGFIRRNTARVPLSRVQAIDLVEPLSARILGLAEVRVRTAGGSGGDARLMYLKQEEAYRVRASLLALAHGLPTSTPPPPERPLLRISNQRLIVSIVLTGASLGTVIGLAAFVALLVTGSAGAAVLGASGGTFIYLVGFLQRAVKRVSAEWNFEAAEAPDGLRIRSGLASRVAETIPYGRIQAIRMIEPLLWRRFGWYRLELHLAGSVKREGRQPSAAVRRALLPVGSRADVELLLSRVLAAHTMPVTRPPSRAKWKAPLSYHFLAAGRNDECSLAVTGRLRRITEWVPLAKVQSIRSDQGPVQRRLGLATVHLDVAGHHVGVSWKDRSLEETHHLLATFPPACEQARDAESASEAATRAARALPLPGPA